VAKILVADDNSNIQKMVGLALKDQGIDVVAVGNGEAAVRKIADLKPDLVLADVFMPVRNGYEVCKFVKEDPAYAHIPVILLVGAFDPLDEQEAQRVGADGVLKKPFVPPDPLIAMVKAALIRAGVQFGGAAAARAQEALPIKAADILAPKPYTEDGPASMRYPSPEPMEATISESGESFVEEGPGHPEPLRMDTGSQPVAFGSLLEGSKTETEDELGLPPAHAGFTEGRSWRDEDSAEPAGEEEGESEAGWRPEIADKIDEIAARSKTSNWHATQFEAVQQKLEQFKSAAQAANKPTLTEAAQAPEVEKGGIEVAESFVTETGVAEEMEVIPTHHEARPQGTKAAVEAPENAPAEITRENFAETDVETTASPVSAYSSEAPTDEVAEEVEAAVPAEAGAPAEAFAETPIPVPVAAKAETAGNSWYSAMSSPWDAEAQKASKLASAWDNAIAVPVAARSAETISPVSSNGDGPARIAHAPEAASAIEDATVAIREEVVAAAVNAGPKSSESSSLSADDLVAKVLAKMSPEVLQAVTREILKPVIEAMVREELKNKK
jgi:CheY-like chemotaxis protein